MFGLNTAFSDAPICGTPLYDIPDGTIVCVQNDTLAMAQLLGGGVHKITGADQILELLQTNVFDSLIKLSQTLTFVQTNVSNLTLYQNIINNLVIGQTNLLNYVNNVGIIQTLSLKQIAQANDAIFLLLCQALQLMQQTGNGFDISIAQSLTLQMLEVDAFNQVLLINQMIATNFDVNETCSNPSGTNPNQITPQTMTIGQTIGCGMIYNIHIDDTLGLLDSTAWT